MHAVEQRLLEVIGIALTRELTPTEARDLRESYQFISNREWARARIHNLMPLALQTKDWEWARKLAVDHAKVMKMY